MPLAISSAEAEPKEEAVVMITAHDQSTGIIIPIILHATTSLVTLTHIINYIIYRE